MEGGIAAFCVSFDRDAGDQLAHGANLGGKFPLRQRVTGGLLLSEGCVEIRGDPGIGAGRMWEQLGASGRQRGCFP